MKAKVKISKQKMLILISTIILSVVAIVGLAMAFLLSYNGHSPQKPTIFDDGKNIYISCQANENYRGYRFKFSANGKDLLIDSKFNIISSSYAVENGATLGTSYDVSTCFLADKEGNNSEFSKSIKWQCCKYLSSPEIKYQEEEKLLVWDEIENADYYKVYINGSDEFKKVEEPKLDLTTIEGGKRSFSVVAASNKSFYKESSVSNILDIKLVHYLPSFSSIEFDLQTKIVTAKCEESYQNVEIILNDRHFIIKNPNIVQEAGRYVYKIDLSLIYENETLIGILPISKDEYNIADKGNIRYVNVQLLENPDISEEAYDVWQKI